MIPITIQSIAPFPPVPDGWAPVPGHDEAWEGTRLAWAWCCGGDPIPAGWRQVGNTESPPPFEPPHDGTSTP